ncbi:hypothetical protein DERF_000379 [Dermatophagoides farinae]|uniref:Uncharacterized protein n=1 Tax=Dermatophagoides farinae TaxID=6954 RepID=A0A922ICQ2_DERFA|nr:hypothetical protein DERF_000379 [Dermatophagoides farinae]
MFTNIRTLKTLENQIPNVHHLLPKNKLNGKTYTYGSEQNFPNLEIIVQHTVVIPEFGSKNNNNNNNDDDDEKQKHCSFNGS